MAQNTKHNLKASTAPMSGIKALMAAAGHKFEDFVYGDVTVPMRAVTILQMLRLCRRFPSLIQVIEGNDLRAALLAAGDDAVAAFVAFACDAEGDAEFEAWLRSAPDDLLEEIAIFAIKVTFRDEPVDVFFLKFLRRLQAEGILPKDPEDENQEELLAA